MLAGRMVHGGFPRQRQQNIFGALHLMETSLGAFPQPCLKRERLPDRIPLASAIYFLRGQLLHTCPPDRRTGVFPRRGPECHEVPKV